MFCDCVKFANACIIIHFVITLHWLKKNTFVAIPEEYRQSVDILKNSSIAI